MLFPLLAAAKTAFANRWSVSPPAADDAAAAAAASSADGCGNEVGGGNKTPDFRRCCNAAGERPWKKDQNCQTM